MKCVADEISGSLADLSAEAPYAIVLEGGLFETHAELRTLSDELVELARRRLPEGLFLAPVDRLLQEPGRL